jgi:hypothetical protein
MLVRQVHHTRDDLAGHERIAVVERLSTGFGEGTRFVPKRPGGGTLPHPRGLQERVPGQPPLPVFVHDSSLTPSADVPDSLRGALHKARGLSHTRASLTIARKLARRCFHALRELGPDALEPVK